MATRVRETWQRFSEAVMALPDGAPICKACAAAGGLQLFRPGLGLIAGGVRQENVSRPCVACEDETRLVADRNERHRA